MAYDQYLAQNNLDNMYDTFQALGQVLVSQRSKMKNLVDDLNALISPIYDLWGSFQAKFMQMKTFRSDFIFLHINCIVKSS